MKNRKNRRSESIPIPFILIGIGTLLIIGVLAWLASRNSPPAAAPTAPAAEEEIPVEQIKRVSLANAKTAFDAKSATFLDVRDAQSFAAGHIPGSVNIPLAELENRTNELNPNQWIITYCT